MPLAVISFATVTKWWCTLPVDAPGTVLTGFPFPFVCAGWRTSLSLQVFVTELTADLLTHFLYWCLLLFCFGHLAAERKIQKAVVTGLWALGGLIIVIATAVAANKDNAFYVKRPFKMEVVATGFQFGWQTVARPATHEPNREAAGE